jgi:voltage-gated potassium channel
LATFIPARPVYGGQSKHLLTKLFERVRGKLSVVPDVVRQFYREGVFSYLAMLVFLMFVFAVAFLVIESRQQDGMPVLDQVVKGNYWAAVTLATVGYGDIVPHTVAGRVMSIVLIFLAMGFVALFTANLTSALTTRKLREGRGLTNAREYTDHLLVLGWKKDMPWLIEDIVKSKRVEARDIVILCDIGTEQAEAITSHPATDGVRLVRGRYHTEEFIKLVNPQRASAILILADESSASTSESEIDSRTVLTAMIIARYVRTGHVVAELLDPAYEPYLRNTKVVDEIIFPRQYGRRFIRLSAANNGVVNAMNALIDGRGGAGLVTYVVPDALTGKTIADLREQLDRDLPGALMIGIIENVGKYYERKTEAVREAQLTPDMEKLVANLQRAKMLENNLPRLNPPSWQVIQPHTIAIVIESPEGL